MSDLHATAEDLADRMFQPIGFQPATDRWVLVHLTDTQSKLRGSQSVMTFRHLTDSQIDQIWGIVPNCHRDEVGPIDGMYAAIEVAETYVDPADPVLSRVVGWTEAFIHELIELNPGCGIAAHTGDCDNLDFEWIRGQLHALFLELQTRMPIEPKDPTP